jgi:hypothetical protein
VKVAGDATTLLGRNPEVGATGVEDNLEALGRSTDGDLGEVLERSAWDVIYRIG